VEMALNTEKISEYRKDVFTQAGEDGIIEKILNTLPSNSRDKWCVEFGAWDGIYLSNARNLILNQGYSAVLIEGGKAKFIELRKNYSSQENVLTLNTFVGFTEKDGLDSILANTTIPNKFDFLSIDVDGNDYHIWKAINKYQPKVICIEFNPTIPTEVSFVQPADPNLNQGSSLLSLVELGKEKGYELVEVLPFNAFFVATQYFSLFKIENNHPAALRKDFSHITYLFTGFDGTIFLSGKKSLPWHGLQMEETRIQRLPKFLRKYKKNYTRFEKRSLRAFMILDKIVFGVITLIFSPKRFFKIMKERRNKT